MAVYDDIELKVKATADVSGLKETNKELKELEQEAFLLVDNIIEKDEPVSYNKCLELMDLIESMYYSGLVFR